MPRPTVHLICTSQLAPAASWRWQEGAAQVLSTFRTASEMLREHPRLLFTQGEAAHHALVEDLDPPLFREIQHLVREGRWYLSGGWHLEPNLRLAGLEPLVRSLALARKYFAERFKSRSRVACCPQSQGAPAGLPQVLRRLGFELLLTRGAPAPGSSDTAAWIRWLGADDTELSGLVLAPWLLDTDSRGLAARLEAAIDCARATQRPCPVFWGLNDHEGGGARDDLRTLDRLIAAETSVEVLHSSLEHLCEAMGSAPSDAPLRVDDGLAAEASGAALSRLRRRIFLSGSLLRQAETLAAAAWKLRDSAYPEDDLAAAWRFHLETVAAKPLDGLLSAAAEADTLAVCGRVEDVARRICLGAAASLQRGASWRVPLPLTVLSSRAHLSRLPVEADCALDHRARDGGEWHLRVFAPDGSEVPCQEEAPESSGGAAGWRRRVVFTADLPLVGAAYFKVEACAGSRRLWPAPAALAHAVDPSRGLLTSLVAGEGVECLAGTLLEPIVIDEAGAVLGRFKLADGPRLMVKGPIRSVTESTLCFGSSRIVAEIVGYAGWPVLEVKLRIEWNEPRSRLVLATACAFPCMTVAGESVGAAGKLPGDGARRPCGRWFAVTAQGGGEAAALGVAARGPMALGWTDQVVQLTVLESRTQGSGGKPDDSLLTTRSTDLGLHELHFAVTAGDPGHVSTLVPGLADWLEAPPLVYPHLPIRMLPHQGGVDLLSLEPATVHLVACKLSADSRALIVRIADASGAGADAILRCRNPDIARPVPLRPFEIKTLRLERGGVCREVDWIDEA